MTAMRKLDIRSWKNPGTERWDEDLVVTPAIATYWLERTSDKQGKVKQGLVDKYAFMRSVGEWDENNDSPIKLDVKHEIIDGKHRLWMVVETGKPTRFHIHYNVPTEVYDVTDTGRLRGLADVGYGDFRDTRTAAVSRAMAIGPPTQASERLSACLPLMREFQERHEEAIKFAAGLLRGGKRGITSGVVGTVARAYYHVPHLELVLFADRLQTGRIDNDGETAALRLRDWLLTPGPRGGTWKNRSETYMKTAHAIELFVSRTPTSLLRAVSEDPFPLPQ